MFSIFLKKEINEVAAKQFWEWFKEKELWIIECINTNNHAFIWKIDEKLKPIFPYFKKELEFQLGYNNEVGEFFFFHLGNKNLIRDAEILKQMMPVDIAKKWKFVIEK